MPAMQTTPRKIIAAGKIMLPCWLLLACLFPLHAVDVGPYRYVKQALYQGEIQHPDLVHIRIDSEIYASTTELYSGILVTDKNYNLLPFSIEKLTWPD